MLRVAVPVPEHVRHGADILPVPVQTSHFSSSVLNFFTNPFDWQVTHGIFLVALQLSHSSEPSLIIGSLIVLVLLMWADERYRQALIFAKDADYGFRIKERSAALTAFPYCTCVKYLACGVASRSGLISSNLGSGCMTIALLFIEFASSASR